MLLHFEVRCYQTTRKSILRLAVHSARIPEQPLTHKEQTRPQKEEQGYYLGHPRAPQSATKTPSFNCAAFSFHLQNEVMVWWSQVDILVRE